MNSLHNDDKTARQIPIHPAANLFPMMEQADYEELRLDILANGQRVPITILNGAVLDGRNRLRVCDEIGIAPEFAYVSDKEVDDPRSWVLSCNLHRRHLTTSQRAMIAAELAGLSPGGNRKTEDFKGQKCTLKDAAGKLKVGERTVKEARAVLASDDVDLITAVKAGEIAVTKAAEIVKDRKTNVEQKIASPKKIVVESEEDAERAKDQQEKRERDAVAENLANKIIKMDHRTRSAVMRRINADDSIKATKMQKVAKEQRRGEGTAKDHVRTCIVESCHRLSSALQQNGPGTNKRWMTACSVEEKSEIRTFAENLSSMAKTLSDYLSENM
jgi:hypothetical protein